MVELVLILAGFIFAFFFLLDLFSQDKNNKENYFITRLTMVIGISIPAFFDATEFWREYKEYFYISFFVSFIFIFLISVYFLNKYVIKKTKELKNNNLSTFLFTLSAFYDGIKKFRHNIKKDIEDERKRQKEYEKTLLGIHKDLDLPKFISDIYANIDCYDDFKKYALYVMSGFISTFFSNNDARFTLRKVDYSKNEMVAILTTRTDKEPSPIPLSSKNMIIASMKDGKPKIYSRNPNEHFDTGKSIRKDIYEDYVTFCLFKDENDTPVLSLNLDVKGEQAKKRMEVLVDTSIFEIVARALIVYIEKKGT